MNPKSIIILDYTNGRVVILTIAGEEPEETFREWCDSEGVSTNNCHWMSWDGNIQIKP